MYVYVYVYISIYISFKKKRKKAVNDDSIATHMYWHVLSVLLTGQKKKKKKKKKKKPSFDPISSPSKSYLCLRFGHHTKNQWPTA